MTRKINDPVTDPLLDPARPINKEEWPVDAVMTFNYLKPPSLTPNIGGGEISNPTSNMNNVRISTNNPAGDDVTAFLSGIGTGDTIAIGATTWTVQSSKYFGHYFELIVTPASQAVVSGSQPVTFHKQ